MSSISRYFVQDQCQTLYTVHSGPRVTPERYPTHGPSRTATDRALPSRVMDPRARRNSPFTQTDSHTFPLTSPSPFPSCTGVRDLRNYTTDRHPTSHTLVPQGPHAPLTHRESQTHRSDVRRQVDPGFLRCSTLPCWSHRSRNSTGPRTRPGPTCLSPSGASTRPDSPA